MIFVKIDVMIPEHHRFLRIPANLRAAALGVWLAANCYTRHQQLDGFCPTVAIEAIALAAVLDSLVCNGLFTAGEHDGMPGYWICRYDKHNDLKAQIEERLATDRTRKASTRMRVAVRADSVRTTDRLSVGIPDSDSDSGSVSDGREGVGERGGVFPMGPRPWPLTPERGAYAAQVPLQNIEAVWKKFQQVAIEKQWAFDSRGWETRWQRFCDTEAVYQRQQRERARGAPSGPGGRALPPPPPLPPLRRPKGPPDDAA